MTRLKNVVKSRMLITGESYSTALMRVRECDVDLRDVSSAVAASIAQSPPRLGNLLLKRRPK